MFTGIVSLLQMELSDILRDEDDLISLMMASLIGVFGLPRIFLTASPSGMPLTGVSSILKIRSPAFRPAR